MTRRVHLSSTLTSGTHSLDASQAHHVRDVLRLRSGDAIEAFDDAGNVAQAVVDRCEARCVSVRVETVHRRASATRIIIASAVPKGERADWMVEKLSELGVHRFIPLQTARSVVHPKGQGKLDRWRRIATESAKQSRRAGVMEIDTLTRLEDALVAYAAPRAEGASALFLSTDPHAASIADVVAGTSHAALHASHLLLIGPEGGWTDEEIASFKSRHLTAVKLTETILRVETAAVAAAAIAAIVAAGGRECPADFGELSRVAEPRAMGSGPTHT